MQYIAYSVCLLGINFWGPPLFVKLQGSPWLAAAQVGGLNPRNHQTKEPQTWPSSRDLVGNLFFKAIFFGEP